VRLRCLVTGGSGFLGLNLLEALSACAEVDHVISVDRFPLPQPLAKVEAVAADARDAGVLAAVLRGVNQVFHLAAESDVDLISLNPTAAVDNNLGTTARLLEASRCAGVGRFVFASTAWVYMNAPAGEITEETSLFPPGPANFYAATKVAGELLCASYFRQFGLPFTVLRFSTPYGRYMRPTLVVQRFLDQAIRGQVITIAGDGRQGRDFLYAEDLARGIISAALCPTAAGKTYNLAGPRLVTIRQLVELILRIVPGAAGACFAEARSTDFIGHTIRRDRANRDFGWQPRVEVEEGVRRVYEWLISSADSAATSGGEICAPV
jgi:UDP-glucose 4-epimerase